MEPSLTPMPVSNNSMSFPDAMRRVIDGRKITRISWKTVDSYGLLKDGWLMIRIDGELHKWTVNDGDLLAEDWVVLPEES